VSYTLDQLDDAIAESVGARAWQAAQGPGFCRPLMLDRAAQQRWWDKRSEDPNADVLREARQDLVTLGHLNPVDGFREE
jgi:hypothetical protein